ncbi:MAG: AAA family ATPase [Leptolyngbyaceae cyanobacterium]
MTHPANEGFADNWAYLKTELTWLDRMLMMALARYRQEKKSVDRIAQSPADQASSHWWKGVISLEGNIAYDEHRPSAQSNSGKTAKAGGTTQPPAGPSPQPQPQAKLGYQQQLDLRIQASKRNGVTLALPWLCDRLKLSLFEKNLILMGLAPEVNRRFARLYRYLQSHDDHLVSDLPSVELVLRLLCRNDQEWRRARQQLNPDAPLMTHNLILLLYQSHDPFLNATVRLADELVDCLLAEDPDPNTLEALLTVDDPATLDPHQWPAPHLLPVDFSNQISVESTDPALLANPNATNPDIATQPDLLSPNGTGVEIDGGSTEVASDTEAIVDVSRGTDNSVLGESENNDCISDDSTNTEDSDNDRSNGQWAPTWSDLVLPSTLLQELQHLPQRFRLHDTVNQYWPEQSPKFGAMKPGLVLLFSGLRGTGKTLAASVLAHDVADSLTCVNLAEIMPEDSLMVMDEVESACPTVVLIQAAEQWLRASASMPTARLSQFLAQRQRSHSLTILSVERVESVAYGWRQQMNHLFHFPMPDPTARRILWQQAFPPKLKLGRTIDWEALSQIKLSGGEIGAIAHDAMVRMVADRAKTLKLQYLMEALQWYQVPDRQIKTLRPARSTRSRKTTRSAVTPSGTRSKRPTSPKSKESVAQLGEPEVSVATDIASPAPALGDDQEPSVSSEVSSDSADASVVQAENPSSHRSPHGTPQPVDVMPIEHHVDANL